MAQHFADDERTKLINDPDFEYNARYGKLIEDSLYTATYNAYRQRNVQMVDHNYAVSTDKYPNGINRPKFMFVHVLAHLNTSATKDLTDELRQLLQKYPDSDVSEMAGMIVKGLESGRKPGTGTFDLGSLWDRRTASADSVATDAAKRASSRQNVTRRLCLCWLILPTRCRPMRCFTKWRTLTLPLLWCVASTWR